MANPFNKNNLFSTPTFNELQDIIERCSNPSEAAMVASMVWNMAHDVFEHECDDMDEHRLPRVNGLEMVAMGPADSDGWRKILVCREGFRPGRDYVLATWKEGRRGWAHGKYDLTLEEGLEQVFG